MSPYLDRPPVGALLIRALQPLRLCAHPTPLTITAMSDPGDLYRCWACGVCWCGYDRYDRLNEGW